MPRIRGKYHGQPKETLTSLRATHREQIRRGNSWYFKCKDLELAAKKLEDASCNFERAEAGPNRLAWCIIN